MRFNKLDLNLLVALDALLTERNISRAGERIHLSQPATSNALARLRAYFDDELLVPQGRQMVLTPRAEALLDPVREVLMRIDSTIAEKPRFDPFNVGSALKMRGHRSLAARLRKILDEGAEISVRRQIEPKSAVPFGGDLVAQVR